MNALTKKITATTLAFGVLLTTAAISTSFADTTQGDEEKRFGLSGEKRAAHKQMMQEVTRDVQTTDSGAVITLTSDNAEVVEKLQSREPKDPKHEGVTRTVESLSNGIKITISGADADTIEKIQDHAENPRQMKKGKFKGKSRGGENGGERKLFRSQVEKSVENLSNGVVITLTSENEEVVTKLQEKEPRTPKNEEVSVAKENISNGVKITLTTENAELVERLQTVSEKKKSHRFHKQGE